MCSHLFVGWSVSLSVNKVTLKVSEQSTFSTFGLYFVRDLIASFQLLSFSTFLVYNYK